MNILKEMGIQQWRRRSARPVVEELVNNALSDESSLNNSQFGGHEHAEPNHEPINTNLRAALNNGPKKSDNNVQANSGFDSGLPVNEPSFEQAPTGDSNDAFAGSLRQALKQSKPGSTKQQPAAKPDVVTQQSDSDAKLEEGVTKMVTPINLSALLPPKEELSPDQVSAELAELESGDYMSQDFSSQGFNSQDVLPEDTNTQNNYPPQVDTEVLSSSDNSDALIETPLTRDLSNADWPSLQRLIDTNEHCPSCGWGNGLLGVGKQSVDWVFIVDAPNSSEVVDKALFVGRAGQLFDSMLGALGLDRESVYCTSVFKCAPTEDLSLVPQCNELVHRQIELLSPKVVVSFGEFASQSVIKSNSPLTSLRSSKQNCFRSQTVVIPTYSPVEMLDDVSLKAHVWDDLQRALQQARF